jgi:glucokinase
MIKRHLVIDIGGTNVKFGLLSPDLKLIYNNSIKLPRLLSSDLLFEWIVNQITEFLNKFEHVETIGIGYPGVVDNHGKILVSPNVSQLVGFELKKNLEDRFGRKIIVDNDANAAAYAELKCGNGTDLANFVYITLGTGVGGALVLNGEIFRGTSFGAGEIGHVIINPFDEINEVMPYRTGVLEEYLGKDAIIKTARNLSKKYNKSPIVIKSLFDVASISYFADKGDLLSIETMKISGYYLGLAIVTVANLMDIPNFILGGGVANSSDIFYQSALDTAKLRVLPQISDKLSIQRAKFADKSGIIGSALIGLMT